MPDQVRDTGFDRIAILVLAVEWVFFGSMHFSATAETAAQIPEFFPLKHHITIITGVAEVTTGILILVPETRRWAAAASLVLLALLVPAMYNILSNPAAVTLAEPAATAFRIVLLPNNIFMAICAVHLWRHPDATLARPGESIRRAPPRWSVDDPVTLIVPALLLMANIAGFLSIVIAVPGRLGLAYLWAMGCIAAGALIGFLFGVPRANPEAAVNGQFVHNTNVEAVSDWLTKILVGVSLVNFQAIGAFTDRLATDLSSALRTPHAFATGLIVYFFVIGIIQGYILTRMFLPRQFGLTDLAAAREAGRLP